MKVTAKNTGAAAATKYELQFAAGAEPSIFAAVVCSHMRDFDFSSARKDVANKKKELAVDGNAIAVNIAAGASVELEITAVYAHQQLPFPEECAAHCNV